MDPDLAPGLHHVRASTTSPYGAIRSSWNVDKDEFRWNVSIPANSKALLAFPVNNFQKIKENQVTLDKVAGVKFLEIKNSKTYIEVGSGTYSFSCSLK